MSLLRTLPVLAALAVASPLMAKYNAAVRPTFEGGALYAPVFGNDFDGMSGGGVFGSLGVEYSFEESEFDEFAICQVEGLYLHGEGRNSIGGVSHRESLDAGYGFLNLGLGVRNDKLAFAVIGGIGIGGGDLQGELTGSDTALNNALQIKPRLTWQVTRHWQVFAEYRFITTSSVNGEFFSGTQDERKMQMHAVGLGLTHRF